MYKALLTSKGTEIYKSAREKFLIAWWKTQCGGSKYVQDKTRQGQE